MNHKLPLFHASCGDWVRKLETAFGTQGEGKGLRSGRRIPWSGVASQTPAIRFADARAVAAALLTGNMNSIPLDYIARTSVGGTNLSFFIVRQLPVLPPEAYLPELPGSGVTCAEAVATRVLELTYTAHDVAGFAADLGYGGPPFRWDEAARYRLRCELDAIFAHMYGLDRSQLEWILDSESPGVSFPTLKRNEEQAFGEYRTQRYVLRAFDQLRAGEPPYLGDT